VPGPSWEDLDEFLDDDDFAFSAVIALQGGGTVSLSGLYDGPYVNPTLGDVEQDRQRHSFTCREDLVGGVHRYDTIAITFPAPVGAKTFNVMTDPHLDGTGIAVLELTEP
jgi:hypothetical protein